MLYHYPLCPCFKNSSSLSSVGNSAACVVWEDYLKPLTFFSGLSDSSATLVVKILCEKLTLFSFYHKGTGLKKRIILYIIEELGEAEKTMNTFCLHKPLKLICVYEQQENVYDESFRYMFVSLL